MSKLKKNKSQSSKPCTALVKYYDLKENTLKIFGLIEEKFTAVKKLEENIKNRKMIMPLGLVIIWNSNVQP